MTQFPHYDSEKGRVTGVVQRVTCRPHQSAGRCLVVALLPGDIVEIREAGRRFRVSEPASAIYDWMLKRQAERAYREKMARKKARSA